MESPQRTPQEIAKEAVSRYSASEQYVSAYLKQNPHPSSDHIKPKLQACIDRGVIESDNVGYAGESIATYFAIQERSGNPVQLSDQVAAYAMAHLNRADREDHRAKMDPDAKEYYREQASLHRRRGNEMQEILSSLQKKSETSAAHERLPEKLKKENGTSGTTDRQRVEQVRSGITELEISPEMREIIDSVVDITIHGKFPNGAYIKRNRGGGSEEVVTIQQPNGGRLDYTEGGAAAIPLSKENPGVFAGNAIEYVLHERRNHIDPSVAAHTQFILVSEFTPQNGREYFAKAPEAKNYEQGYSVVTYMFENDDADFSGRPTRGVQIRTLIPTVQADRLLTLLHADPDAIEQFYRGVAPGFEDVGSDGKRLVNRMTDDELVILDTRLVPSDVVLALDGTFVNNAIMHWPSLLNAMEAMGKIPHLKYGKNDHGTVGREKADFRLGNPDNYRRMDYGNAQSRFSSEIQKIREMVAVKNAPKPHEIPPAPKKRFGLF
jgi:hypothetical protein